MLDNHTDSPLVTVQLMCHEAGLKYLARAYASLTRQTLPHKDIQVQFVFDGTPSEAFTLEMERLAEGHDFNCVTFAPSVRHYGYYCTPKNLAMTTVYAPYVAYLDIDNELAPEHLAGLVAAIRTADEDTGWPHFVYSRRFYIRDSGVTNSKLPEGASPLVEWTPENCQLLRSPRSNFIDTADLLIGAGVLDELANRSGCSWNSEMRRFGDWDLARRLALHGFRGKAIDQVTNIYHWTGDNLQLTRPMSEINFIPRDVYEALKAQKAQEAHAEDPASR